MEIEGERGRSAAVASSTMSSGFGSVSPLAHEETKQGFALAFQREDMAWESASPGEGRV
jgi:hypothetical protein